MKTFSIKTLGCKVNQYDSQVIRERLLADGYTEVSELPDLCVVNTCCVTYTAEKKSRRYINHIKKQYPNSQLLVTGCMSKKVPDAFFTGGISRFNGRTRAFVKIQDGCDEFCSYCVLPYVRGRSRSRDLGEILDEVNRLVSNGYREVVLTGVHLGDYDRLPELLREIRGPLRVRLSSIDPQDFTDILLEVIYKNPKICRHLHIPLQSASNRILERMDRRYTYRMYKELIGRMPGFTFTTDVIVGFPGETEEDFLATCNAVRVMGFIKVHIFPYSQRPGTQAANFLDRIPQVEIRRRVKVLKDISEETARAEKIKLIGSTQEVLVESAGVGYTSGYVPVRIKGDSVVNEIAKVKIIHLDGQYLIGMVT